MTESPAPDFLPLIWNALEGEDDCLQHVGASGEGALPSTFAVTELATASVSAAALAVSELVAAHTGHASPVLADRRLASFWFATSFRPEGWSAPPTWDAIAGDYATNDAWIRLHTNAPHHRAAALGALSVEGTKDTVAAAVKDWQADALETAIIERGGCAAAMRSLESWAEHPQGRSVAAEPLVRSEETGRAAAQRSAFDPTRPLAGVRVLDLTRILAGPVATRFLAGFGAEVLRIDPPTWNEANRADRVGSGSTFAPGRKGRRRADGLGSARDQTRVILSGLALLTFAGHLDEGTVTAHHLEH